MLLKLALGVGLDLERTDVVFCVVGAGVDAPEGVAVGAAFGKTSIPPQPGPRHIHDTPPARTHSVIVW